LIVEEHVAGTRNELKLRASAGLHNAIVDGPRALRWDQSVFLPVKKQRRASDLGRRIQQLPGRSTQGNVHHTQQDLRAGSEQRELALQFLDGNRLRRENVCHHTSKDSAVEWTKQVGAKHSAREARDGRGPRQR
jgi:hypothetical protein